MAAVHGSRPAKEEGLVVADREVAENDALETDRRLGEQRGAVWSRLPVETRELVHQIAGLFSEAACQLSLIRSE